MSKINRRGRLIMAAAVTAGTAAAGTSLLWGVPGAVLAVPLTSAIKVVCENVKGWEGFARLLGEPDTG